MHLLCTQFVHFGKLKTHKMHQICLLMWCDRKKNLKMSLWQNKAQRMSSYFTQHCVHKKKTVLGNVFEHTEVVC